MVVGGRRLLEKSGLLALAGDAISDVDASLGGVAGLARVNDVVGLRIRVRKQRGS